MPSIIAWTIWSSIVFIAFSVWGLLMFYAHRSTLETEARKRFAVASGVYLLGWLVLAFVLGSAGVFQATPSRAFSPVAVGIAVAVLTGMFLLSRSSTLNAVIAAIPLPWLVGVQLYRVLGLNFLVLYALGSLPAEFAIPAGVGDVVVGLTAPVVGYLFYKGYRWSCLAVLGWNIVGILDLVVAVATGFLSSPGPFQVLALETPNELITAFPLVLVPVFAVPLSILLHLAALKRLKAVLEVASNKGLRCGGQPLRWASHPAVP
ncbi:MAG TPA: hypothetical protein VJL56_03470 [Candidatus Bathyarchaeia archaeon]|nr:hypothetical protein [Candidatus Bathyarchaeia archaeon]